MNLSRKGILLLAQGWRGTLYSMKNFADMNGIDWDDVVHYKDPTSSSKTAYAESLVDKSLEKTEYFLAYLNELFSKEDDYVIEEINKELAEQDLVVVLEGNKWKLVGKSRSKDNKSYENSVSKTNKQNLPDKQGLKISPSKTKDKKRSLTHTEKIWVWENKSHECHICGKIVEKFSDANFDHTRAHAKGGKTTPANSEITHSICNRLKGKKSLKEIRKHLGIKSKVEKTLSSRETNVTSFDNEHVTDKTKPPISIEKGNKGPNDKIIKYDGKFVTIKELGEIYAELCKNEDVLYPRPRFKGSDILAQFLEEVRKAGKVTDEIRKKYKLK